MRFYQMMAKEKRMIRLDQQIVISKASRIRIFIIISKDLAVQEEEDSINPFFLISQKCLWEEEAEDKL
jgi:uncharacterized protein YueI